MRSELLISGCFVIKPNGRTMAAVFWGVRSGAALLPALISKTGTVLFIHYAASVQPFIRHSWGVFSVQSCQNSNRRLIGIFNKPKAARASWKDGRPQGQTSVVAGRWLLVAQQSFYTWTQLEKSGSAYRPDIWVSAETISDAQDNLIPSC